MSFLSKAAKGFGLMSSTPQAAAAYVDEDGDAFVDPLEAHLHQDAHEDGGLQCNDLELLDRQRSAIVEVMKSMGKNLLAGNFDLLKVSLPVKLFEPRSFLQKLADPFVFTRLLDAAAASKDPVQRMQYTASAMVAGYHRVFRVWAKPFNPILGETWQASLPDGTTIFTEQVSHHPPVSAFQMFGAHGKYYFHGLSQPSVSYKGNTIKTHGKGYRRIEFADGGAIEITFPAYFIKGLLYTSAPKADLGGVAEFIDHRNGLLTILTFGKVEGAPAGSLSARSDTVSGTMYRTALHGGGALERKPSTTTGSLQRSKSSSGGKSFFGKSFSIRPTASSNALGLSDGDSATTDSVRIPVSTCSGNWLSHIDWDEQRIWTLLDEPLNDWIPDPNPLPSDSRFREDLRLLAAGDVAAAQVAKEDLENRQRAEAKLRKGGGSG